MTVEKLFQENKAWYKSKINGVAIITIAVGISTFLLGQVEIGVPVTLLGVVNFVARTWFTKANLTS